MEKFILLTAVIGLGDDPFIPEKPAVPTVKPKTGVETRKEARDAVLRNIGNEALSFTKAFGDLGIASLQVCSPETGKKLVAHFNSGEFARLKNPRIALEVIRLHGNQAAAWLCDHIDQLSDPEGLDVWVKEPMDYVFDLKDIQSQASELRASRRFVPGWVNNTLGESNIYPALLVAALVLTLIIVSIRRVRPMTRNDR